MGDEVRAGNVTITVKAYRNRRVRSASFRINPVPEEGEEQDRES